MNLDVKSFLLLVIVVIISVWFVYPWLTSERFNSVSGPSNPNRAFEKNEPEPQINPLVYEPELAIVTSASEFVGLPDVVLPPWGQNPGNYGEADILDDGDMGNAGLNYNLCSKSCCSPQFPPPFATGVDELTCKNKGEFVPTSYGCNNAWQDSGCVCMTKKQSNFLASRGGNGWGNNDIRVLKD